MICLNDDGRSYTVPEQIEEQAFDLLALKEAGEVTVKVLTTRTN